MRVQNPEFKKAIQERRMQELKTDEGIQKNKGAKNEQRKLNFFRNPIIFDIDALFERYLEIVCHVLKHGSYHQYIGLLFWIKLFLHILLAHNFDAPIHFLS